MSAFDALETQLRTSATRRRRRGRWTLLRPVAALALLAIALVVIGRGEHSREREVVATPTSAAPSGVPAAELAAFAVLRRAQTDADRTPTVEDMLKRLAFD